MAQHYQADNLPVHSPQIYLSKGIKVFSFICLLISTNLSWHSSWFSVADPHHFNADPDPACHFDADADPDPACHFDAAPDPNFYLSLWWGSGSGSLLPNKGSKPWKSDKRGSYSIHFGASSVNWCRSGSGLSLMRILLFNLMLIHADPDPWHWLV